MLFHVLQAEACPICSSPYITVPYQQIINTLKQDKLGRYRLTGIMDKNSENQYHCSACDSNFNTPLDMIVIITNDGMFGIITEDCPEWSYLSVVRVPFARKENDLLLLPKEPEEVLYISPLDEITSYLVHALYSRSRKEAKQAFSILMALACENSQLPPLAEVD